MPELYFIAGPNGCGKSTLAHHLLESPKTCDLTYICPDTIALKIKPLCWDLAETELIDIARRRAQALRDSFVDGGRSFINESVCSHESHIDFLRKAKQNGFQIFVYYVALDSPSRCIDRVKQRVSEGGHNVDATKIIKRYERSLNLLPSLMEVADRCLVFDNTERYKLIFDKNGNSYTCLSIDSALSQRILKALYAKKINVICP